MPWKTETVEMKRKEFVSEAFLGDESFSAVCRKYEITRRTGYKWLERYATGECLNNRSKEPHFKPLKTLPEKEEAVLKTRSNHPTWGGRKIHRYLVDKGVDSVPAPSTITAILKRNGCISPEATQIHTPYQRFVHDFPNDLWQMDFKGHFPMLDNDRCHPLTISDDHSRMLLCLDAWGNERADGVKASLMRSFRQYGLPRAILCDNGSPWGDSKQGYTLLELWMMQMDILPIHGRPMHPQTQGKEERFHRTLNEDLIKRTLFRDLLHAQEKFDLFRHEFNFERPHNALNLDVPAKHYCSSPRPMPEHLSEPEYDLRAVLRKVNFKGYISIQNHRYYISETFIGKLLQYEPLEDDIIRLCYGQFQIAKIDLKEQLFISRKIYRK